MIIVFTGPTIAPADARKELDAIYLPPVSQGDLYRAAIKRPRAIGIIDGYFDAVPSVWHKEILWAMSQGIHVFGSSSMGALRAAELWRFGMVGVGRIFEEYRDGVIEDDDEVALLHAPAEYGYLGFSEPLANIRHTLASAAEAGVITEVAAGRIANLARELFYPERTYDRILERAEEAGVADGEIAALRAWLPEGAINRKREDALEMLRAMGEFIAADPPPKSVDFHFEPTALWADLMRTAGELDITSEEAPAGYHTDELIETLELDPEFEELRQGAITRLLKLDEARRHDYQPDQQALVDAVIRFRERHGLLEPSDLEGWMGENGLDREGFLRLMAEEAAIWWVDGMLASEAHAIVPSHLRALGRFSELRPQSA